MSATNDRVLSARRLFLSRRFALFAIAALGAGCNQADDDRNYTRFDAVIGELPVNLGDARPIVQKPRDGGRRDAADATDAGLDATADAGADAALVEADMALVPDATVDAAVLECERASDCVLAVALESCDPCPIVTAQTALSPDACLVQFDRFVGFSSHIPFSCIEECLVLAVEFCANQLPIADCVDNVCVDGR